MTSNCDKQVSSEDAKKMYGSKPDPCSFDSTVSTAVYSTMTGKVGVNFGIMSMLNVMPWMAMANLGKKALQVATEKLGKLGAKTKVGALTAVNDPKEAFKSAVVNPVSSAVNATGNAVSTVGTAIKDTSVSAVNATGNAVSAVGTTIKDTGVSAVEGAKDLSESVSKTTSAWGQSMKDRFNKLRGKTGGGDAFTEEECSFF